MIIICDCGLHTISSLFYKRRKKKEKFIAEFPVLKKMCKNWVKAQNIGHCDDSTVEMKLLTAHELFEYKKDLNM